MQLCTSFRAARGRQSSESTHIRLQTYNTVQRLKDDIHTLKMREQNYKISYPTSPRVGARSFAGVGPLSFLYRGFFLLPC